MVLILAMSCLREESSLDKNSRITEKRANSRKRWRLSQNTPLNPNSFQGRRVVSTLWEVPTKVMMIYTLVRR